MLNLELLIRLRRHLYFVSNPALYRGFALSSAPHDLVCEDSLIDDAIKRARSTEVRIVNIAILGWIYSYKVSSLLILIACFSDHIPMPQSDSFAHSFMDWCHVFLGVLSDVSFNHLE